METKLLQVDDPADFWCLIDELLDDKSGFFHNRNTLLKAFKDGTLYSLHIDETEEMFTSKKRDPVFIRNSFYLLPCLCVKQDDAALIIWTHTRARNRGFARKLIQLLGIQTAIQPLQASLGFWEKCNITL